LQWPVLTDDGRGYSAIQNAKDLRRNQTEDSIYHFSKVQREHLPDLLTQMLEDDALCPAPICGAFFLHVFLTLLM